MQRDRSYCDFSRRGFLGLVGLGAAGLLVGCETPPPDVVAPPRLIEAEPPLPEPVVPSHSAALAPGAPINTYGILPRSAWTSERPNYGHLEAMNGVRMITFHHTGDYEAFYGTTYSETIAQLQKDRNCHCNERGWGDIGYHFAIDRAGRVWQLRSLRYQGAHVWGRDEHNIGVVVLGNFELQSPTAQQCDRIRQFAPLLRRIYKLPASCIHTHREIALPGHGTLCPGRHLQPTMDLYRQKKYV